MNRKITYLIFGISLLTLRLIFNYNSELIAGINGGYYPLQVRTLLETGHLGFSDMPLYFYLNAFIVKIASLLTNIDIDVLIIHTLKIIDSISLPLLVFPLYLTAISFFGNERPKTFEIIFIGFATLSFSPLILTSDLQKNAFAIPLMLFFIYYLLAFIRSMTKKNILLSIIFIILIGLTHFGVFSISIIILIISLLVIYRKKAILPILGILIFGILMVFLFDSSRAERLFSLWNIIFEKPIILQGPLSPPDLFNYIFSYVLLGLGILYLTKRKHDLSSYQRNTLTIFLPTIFILSFPLLDIEYARRFSLLLFIPQIIVLFVLSDFFNKSLIKIIGAMLVLITTASVLLMTSNIKPSSITKEAFQDLKNIEQYISEPDKTLIIARHGLEWWTAWQLDTKVGQDKSLSNETFLKYEKIICLVQLDGINHMHPGEKSPFHEPFFPTKRKPFYSSNYFRATELKSSELDKMHNVRR